MAKGVYIGVGGTARKVKKIYVGVGGVARKVKKAYIGVGGVARLFFSGGELAYYGTATSMINTPTSGAANSSYAAFTWNTYTDDGYLIGTYVDGYNSTLTRVSAATALAEAKNQPTAVATSSGGHVIFAASSDANSTYSQTAEAYDTSLVKVSVPNLFTIHGRYIATANVGDYCLFAGGMREKMASATLFITAYNSSLTRLNANISMDEYRAYAAAASAGNYVFITGGKDMEGGTLKTVQVFDSSFTKHANGLYMSTYVYYHKGLSIGGYALFCSGYQSSGYFPYTDVFNSSMTKITATALVTPSWMPGATVVGDFAVLAGGNTSGGRIATVETYDTSLTLGVVEQGLSTPRSQIHAATIGGYALFAGGHSGSANMTTVDVFTA